MIWVVHPGSGSRDPDYDFLPIPDPGSRGQKGTGSRIRIRNTELHSNLDPCWIRFRVQEGRNGPKKGKYEETFCFDELDVLLEDWRLLLSGNSLTQYYQKTQVFCTMLFTVDSTGGFLSIVWFSQT
jgi:hypothetical protein